MADYLRQNVGVREDEDILRVIRRHWITLFWDYFFVFFFIVGPFFLIVPLFRWGMNGIIVFFALLSCGVILALRTFVSWYFNALIITTERVIDICQRGFFDRVIMEAFYTEIQDVTFHRRGLLQLLFRHGTISMRVQEMSTPLVMQHFPNPERVQEIIVKSVEHVQQQIQPSPDRRGEGEVVHRTDGV